MSARVTVEAKGTAGSVNSALADAVEQAKGSGRRSRSRRLAWGQQAHFEDPGWAEQVWSASLVDPPSDNFEFPRSEEVLVAYFAPLVRDVLADESLEFGEEDNLWRVADLGDTGVQIAIRSDVAAAADEADGAALLELCGLADDAQLSEDTLDDEIGATLAYSPAQYWGLPSWPDSTGSRESFVGPDGVAIRVSSDGAQVGGLGSRSQ